MNEGINVLRAPTGGAFQNVAATDWFVRYEPRPATASVPLAELYNDILKCTPNRL
jgi:hypothetical protein